MDADQGAIFERRLTFPTSRPKNTATERLEFGRQPMMTIDDAQLHHPHSVAFSNTNHLLVANAGANDVSVVEPESHSDGMRWPQMPLLTKRIAPDEIFRQHHSRNRQEGGPKGIAVYGNHLAVCNALVGIHSYAFRELPAEMGVGA